MADGEAKSKSHQARGKCYFSKGARINPPCHVIKKERMNWRKKGSLDKNEDPKHGTKSSKWTIMLAVQR